MPKTLSTSTNDPNFEPALIALFRSLFSSATGYPDDEVSSQVGVRIDSNEIESGYLIAVRDSDDTPQDIRQAAAALYWLIVEHEGSTNGQH